MSPYTVLTGILILSTTCFIVRIVAQTTCTDGWFGSNCEYQCHCGDSAPCDKVDGSCSSGCDFYWFGPACQYIKALFSAGQGWLTDFNDGTCNPGTSTSETVTLRTAISLTWLRVVVNDAEFLDQIQLSYRSHSSQPRNCSDLKTAKVDDVTLDIYCTTVTTVKQVTLSGLGVAKLCSLYISGGRNVALDQPAQQSSRYLPSEAPNSFLAENAVDGRASAPTREDSRITCTHTTAADSPDWWRVNFTNAVEIIWFQIYNRQDCCGDRLVGFTLTAQPESSSSGTPFTYTDPGRSDSDAKGDYNIVPANKISYPIGQVQVGVGTGRTMLTLCEVYVFGESPCPSNKFGLACERQCNCASGGRPCFIHSGGCPDGCAPNHTGEDCYDCVDGKYGPNCGVDCSIHCAGDKSCDKISGGCNEGCEPGYTGDQCLSECDVGTYGAGCSSTCNSFCAGEDNACHHVTGDCDSCPVGRHGDFCSNICSPYCAGPDNAKPCDRDTGDCMTCPSGRFGSDCQSNCNENCKGPNNTCKITSGDCDLGCDPGYEGTKCEQVCGTGTYGDECKERCSEHCAGENNACHHVNGTCDLGCDPGYQGALCTDKCDANKWGLGCENECAPTCDNECNHVNGDCVCSAGYWGSTCQNECNATRYGVNCQETCSLDCVDQLCHHETGTCITCPEGKTGEFCALQQQSEGGSGATMGAVVGAVVGVVLLIVVVVAVFIIFWRRRRSKNGGQLQEEIGTTHNRSVGKAALSAQALESPSKKNRKSNNQARRSNAPMDKSEDEISSEEENDAEDTKSSYINVVLGDTSISVGTLKSYILDHASDSYLKDEFMSIPMANSSPQRVGLSPENVKKNRYKNIIPYDSSRVPLKANPDQNQSDYINASFMKGYRDGETFIASQGPNDKMQDDFVRMLWEQQVDRIVMLTRLVEQGKKKCNMYWPSDGEEDFGEISVKLLTTHVFAEYTIRHLRLSKNGEASRELTQFHFTAWPDKLVPESPWGLVDLHQRVMATPGSGPILVHCSAGVGRTGTFIALCNLLEEAEATGKMDFRAALWKLRQERMHTIQTVAQYTFLHKVALVAYTVAGTTIQINELDSRLASLEDGKGGNRAARSYLQEFEALCDVCDATSTKPNESTEAEDVYQNTSSTVDKTKNRLSNILPNQAFRPLLTAEAHREDTYINAVFVPTLLRDSQDILTQLPLGSTETDFWRLVTQFDVGLIVTYETDLKSTDETIGDFIPKSETEPFENDRFRINMNSSRESKYFNEVSLVIKKKPIPGMDGLASCADKTIDLLECKTTQLNPEAIFEIQEKIRSLRPNGKSRVVFMCRNGADQCGMASVQAILLDRLNVDGCLTVPLVVGAVKAIRPQVIPTVDQYKCLYRVLKLAHDSQNVYSNV